MANSVDPVLFSFILNSSLILGNYLQQTTSADYIFRCIFFLGALRLRVELLKFMLGKCFVIFCLQIFSTFFFSNILSGMANSLDPDQAPHFVGPDLDASCLQRLSAAYKICR